MNNIRKEPYNKLLILFTFVYFGALEELNYVFTLT